MVYLSSLSYEGPGGFFLFLAYKGVSFLAIFRIPS